MNEVCQSCDAYVAADTLNEAGYCHDCRQAADFGGFEPTYHAALVVIANEPGAGRFARAINLVAAIFGKTSTEVLRDAVTVA